MKNEHVLELVDKIGGDGWTIFNAEDELFDNLSDDIRKRATKTHKSDGSPKGSIWVDGEIKPQMEGIYALDLMWILAEEVGADVERAGMMGGRGFCSMALAEAINRKLAPEKEEE